MDREDLSTYYRLRPVIDISRKGAGWADVRFDTIIPAAYGYGAGEKAREGEDG